MRKLAAIVLLAGLSAFAWGQFGFAPISGPDRVPWVFVAVAEEEAPSYWTDPYEQDVKISMETTNVTATLDTGKTASYHATNMPTVATGPTWTIAGTNENGRVEYCYSFNGVSTYFEGSPNAWTGNVGTITAWIKTRQYDNGAHQCIFNYWANAASQIFMWGVCDQASLNGNLLILAANGGAAKYMYSTTTIPTNTWTHVAITSSGTAWTMYTNATQLTLTGTGNTGLWANDIASPYSYGIGVEQQYDMAKIRYFDGLIDDLRLYPNILTSNDLQTLMESTQPTNNLEQR